MAIIGIVVVGVGLLLILAGLYVSLKDFSTAGGSAKTFQNEPLGLPETIDALTKLALALLKHRLGMQLIIMGVLLVTVGGILGGVAGL